MNFVSLYGFCIYQFLQSTYICTQLLQTVLLEMCFFGNLKEKIYKKKHKLCYNNNSPLKLDVALLFFFFIYYNYKITLRIALKQRSKPLFYIRYVSLNIQNTIYNISNDLLSDLFLRYLSVELDFPLCKFSHEFI